MSEETKKNMVNPRDFIVKSSGLREASIIRELMPLMRTPGMISLGGGLPNPGGFPIKSVSFTLKNGEKVEWDQKEMMNAFQYSTTPGLPGLQKILGEYSTLLHNRTSDPKGNDPRGKWGMLVTTGSQDGLSKSFDMLVNEGDSVILGVPAYPGTLSNLAPKQAYKVGVSTDDNGMNVDELEDTLANFETKHPGAKFPKVVYTIPTGSNPSGSTLSLPRKKKLLALASKYNLIILEDDPYFFLTFTDDTEESLAAPASDRKAWNVPESLFSLDTENRVIRFDSFSKVLSAGFRIGWVSAPLPFLQRLVLHGQASILHTSGVSQQMAVSVLSSMKPEGFLAHVRNVRALYKSRRDIVLGACEKYLTGLATWNVPVAGMFVWITLTDTSKDTWALITEKAVAAKVLFVPGAAFSLTNKTSHELRASYSVAGPEQLDEAIKRLSLLLKEQ